MTVAEYFESAKGRYVRTAGKAVRCSVKIPALVERGIGGDKVHRFGVERP